MGDIVFVLKNEDNSGETWSLAKIVGMTDDSRKLELAIPKPGGEGTSNIIRSPRNCVLIAESDSIPLNSTSYFQIFHSKNEDADN